VMEGDKKKSLRQLVYCCNMDVQVSLLFYALRFCVFFKYNRSTVLASDVKYCVRSVDCKSEMELNRLKLS
jgi:hypothetical protein